MYDALLKFTASGTTPIVATTSATSDNLTNIPTGTPRRGLKVRVNITAASGTGENINFTLLGSANNTNFTPLANNLNGTLRGTGVDYIPFEASNAYYQLAYAVAGTSPSFTFTAEVGEARP